jgi:erythromycin esterase-like protein
LQKVDPEGAARARERYSCFDHFGEDTQTYGYSTALGIAESCEDEVVNQLTELHRRAAELANRDGRVAEDEFFTAEQNARLVKNAEQYYRTMYKSDVSSWNLRDKHMVETLVSLEKYLERYQKPAKLVVWEHNSHLGDARATEMGRRGEWNVGQLVREIYGDAAFLIGFTTYTGSVMAADDWDAPAKIKRIRPALEDSYENLMHDTGLNNFLLNIRSNAELTRQLTDPMLERAIGVIYRPETERYSHYFQAHLAQQFDSIMHFDETHPLTALEAVSELEPEELPETYPTGM